VVICRRTERADQSRPPASSVGVTLHGYPRDGFDLKSVFQPPGEDTGSDSFGEGPSAALATCWESVLGAKWVTPGRLLPPAHAGLELVVVSESAVLHAIRVPADVVKRCCFGHGGSAGTAATSSSSSGRLDVPAAANTAATTAGVAAAPKYGLRKSVASARAGTYGSSARLRSGPGAAGAGASASNTLNSTSSLRYTGVGEGSDACVEFWAVLQREALTLEESLCQGALEGLSISRVDQYARQVRVRVCISGSIHHLW
jgi:hypothetical protein